jgi:neopullulanase
MKKKTLLVITVFLSFSAFAIDYYNTYPTHWWAGMKNPKLQLILHGKDVGLFTKVAINYLGVKIEKVNKVENKNYIFLDLTIAANTKPGVFKIIFSGSGMDREDVFYELKPRSSQNGKTRIKGVTSEDFVYLLMPDRFSNGDPSNDFLDNMRDKDHDRNNPFDRHGGDLLGVQNHLDYLQELGLTSLWMTPVNENDMGRTMENGTSRSTYHGYAFTNQYEVDKRLGGNSAYRNLSDELHRRGMKLIQDAVYNHVGIDHWSVKDLPMKDWLNQWPSFTQTSYKDQPLVDPYAAAGDKKRVIDGWFTSFLVDLNQRNPYVSNFLVQYAIWATEEFGVDGWRVDTYFYNDPVFLNKINDALVKEFPRLTVFGETSVNSAVNGAYFCQNNLNVPFKHNCPGITDFPVRAAMLNAIKQPYGWNEGVSNLYQVLAQDVLYKNPMRNCIFLGSHDEDRFYSIVGEDFEKYKMGMTLLLTQRGIPQMYYGDEILMKNFKDPTDAEVRKDFPGGWPGDAVNKFNASERTEAENRAFDFVKKLAAFRKQSSAIKTGKLLQFVPYDGLYVYFRYDAKQTVMVVLNTGDKNARIDWKRFEERGNGYTQVRNVISDKLMQAADLEIKPKESFVFELVK